MGATKFPHPYHPWDWYISLHLVDFYGINVGKYTIHSLMVWVGESLKRRGRLVDFSKLVMQVFLNGHRKNGKKWDDVTPRYYHSRFVSRKGPYHCVKLQVGAIFHEIKLKTIHQPCVCFSESSQV